MRPARLLLVFVLVGCGSSVPAPCEEMCAQAAVLYGGCVEEWGLDWPAVGYADSSDYVESCETWAWEAELLTRGQDWTEATCAERAADFAAPDATCDTYTAVDWSVIGE